MIDLINEVYVYCTDFTINLANLLNLSYYEINAIIFCAIYPMLTVGSILLYMIQKRRLKRLMFKKIQ